MKACVLTLGCKAAQYESEAMAEGLLLEGFTLEGSPAEDTDVLILNTCTVTAEADRKCRRTVARARKKNPTLLTLLCGCYAEREGASLLALPSVVYVGGTQGKGTLPALAAALVRKKQAGEAITPAAAERMEEAPTYEPLSISSFARTRAYIKIQDGCDGHCTYCAIKRARGPSRSREPASLLEEIRAFSAHGCREVVLTGIELASYRYGEMTLIDLLEMLDQSVNIRYRLGSLSPEWLTQDVIRRLSRLRNLAPSLHLSVQSGSNEVLRRMARRARAEEILASVARLRAELPGVTFTGDVIVGFPGESKENFAETLKLIEEVCFIHLHVFPYSKRKGTPAALYPGQVSEEEKTLRLKEALSLSKAGRDRILSEVLARGEPLPVLFEQDRQGASYGHTPHFLEVVAEGASPLAGKEATVRPVALREGKLLVALIDSKTV